MQFGVGLSSIKRILTERKITDYKCTQVQELKAFDLPKRFNFCRQVTHFIRQDQTDLNALFSVMKQR